MNISVDRRQLTGGLILATVILTLANLCHLYLWAYRDTDLRGISWLFEMSGDSTVPTWFSSFILLLSAALFFVIGRAASGTSATSRQWQWLALVFVLLSVDEVATIHETSTQVLDLDTTGYFFYSWVLIGMIAVVGFCAAFFRFFRTLDQPLQIRLAVAGLVYVGGALGVEMINAHQDFTHGADTAGYRIGTAVEELLEMTGVVILIDALILHLRKMGATLQLDTVEIRPKSPSERAVRVADRRS